MILCFEPWSRASGDKRSSDTVPVASESRWKARIPSPTVSRRTAQAEWQVSHNTGPKDIWVQHRFGNLRSPERNRESVVCRYGHRRRTRSGTGRLERFPMPFLTLADYPLRGPDNRFGFTSDRARRSPTAEVALKLLFINHQSGPGILTSLFFVGNRLSGKGKFPIYS
jgi:hypothetical protein